MMPTDKYRVPDGCWNCDAGALSFWASLKCIFIFFFRPDGICDRHEKEKS